MLCNGNEILDNTMKKLKIDTKTEIVVGRINGKLFACNNYCPHRGASLSKSKIKPNENRIVCYMHYFEYDLQTGKLMEIPDMWKDQSEGWKKSDDLQIYSIKEDEQGNITVNT